MQTIYDWLSLALFCALATLFLQRSVSTPIKGDRMALYIPPVLGCAAGDYLGNGGHALIAAVVLVAAAAYAVVVLRPGRGRT